MGIGPTAWFARKMQLIRSESEPAAAEKPAALERFDAAVADYQARRFAEARDGFRQVIASSGGSDGPSDFYVRLCDVLIRRPPPPEWNATLTFESK